MNRSRRDPDAIDRIRDDAIMTEASDKLQEQAARIASLEAQLAAATERERRINQRAEILFDGIQGAHDMVTRWLADPSAPATDKIIELAGLLETRMDVTGLHAAALAAAQQEAR